MAISRPIRLLLHKSCMTAAALLPALKLGSWLLAESLDSEISENAIPDGHDNSSAYEGMQNFAGVVLQPVPLFAHVHRCLHACMLSQ